MLIYKLVRKVQGIVIKKLDGLFTYIILKGNSVKFKNFSTIGVPYVMVARGDVMTVGKNFKMNNGIKGNPIGCYSHCTFFVDRSKKIVIGDNVGVSQCALIAIDDITIEDDVKIGGGVKVYTSDFHSLDPNIRKTNNDMNYRKKAPVVIRKNAFIGAFSIILKGVDVGENSIIGAGSVVTKSIPANEIWAGNPAKFIRKISN